MTKWVSAEWYTAGDFGSKVPTSSDGTGYSTDTEQLVSGGSGSTPPIVQSLDYLLRDEAGEVITDESGDELSLEGL